MKRIIAVLIALALLSAVAFADVVTTGNVFLRTQPNLKGEKITAVPEDTYLEYLGSDSVDERGVTWYNVRYDDQECWVSSRYSYIGASEYDGPMEGEYIPDNIYDETTGKVVAEIFFHHDLIESAYALALEDYDEDVFSEVPNRYYNDGITLMGSDRVECINVTGEDYMFFGGFVGMNIEEASDVMQENGLTLSSTTAECYVFEHPADQLSDIDVDGFDSCLNVYIDADGVIIEMDWSSYTG